MIYRFDPFSLDTQSLELRKGDDVVPLEPQVFNILAYLIEHRDRVVGKEELIENIWNGRAISDGALNSRINSARRAVGDSGSAQAVIKTFTRRGFRFVGPVTDSPAVETPAAPAESLPDKPSIAVLPFENISGDPEQEFFADGMTDDLITDLSKISGLFVIARNSSFSYKEQPIDVRRIGRELGVRHILQGSVRRAGRRVRINAQLIDTASGGHVWAERYDGDLEDIFSLQDQIGQRIVSALEVELNEKEREGQRSRYEPRWEAYEHFMRGRHLVHQGAFRRGRERGTGPSLDRMLPGRDLFSRAIELDPAFAGGYAGLSWTYSVAVRLGFSPSPDKDLQEALRLAELAVEIDDSFAWSHTALASVLIAVGRHDEAVAAARRAVDLQPSDADSLAYFGYFLMWSGRPKEAIGLIEQALRLDPRFEGRSLSFLGIANFGLGQYAEAVNWLEAATGPENSDGMAIHFVWVFLAAAYACLGQRDEATSTIDRLLGLYPDFTLTKMRALVPYKNAEDIERLCDVLSFTRLPA